MSAVLAVLDILGEDQWMFNTLPDRSKPNIHSKIHEFVHSSPAAEAFKSAAKKTFGVATNHHVIGAAVSLALHHMTEMPEGSLTGGHDLEEAVHNHIMNLSTNLHISAAMAHEAMTHAVGHLKALRGVKEAKDEHDSQLDDLLKRLHQALKRIGPRYQEPKKK